MASRIERAWFEHRAVAVLVILGAIPCAIGLLFALNIHAPALGLWNVLIALGGTAIAVIAYTDLCVRRQRARGIDKYGTGPTVGEMAKGAGLLFLGLYKLGKWLLIAAAILFGLVLVAKGLWWLLTGMWNLI